MPKSLKIGQRKSDLSAFWTTASSEEGCTDMENNTQLSSCWKQWLPSSFKMFMTESCMVLRDNKGQDDTVLLVAWNGHSTDINNHLSSCEKGQKMKMNKRATANFLSPLPLCNAPNQGVHIDFFGPLKTSGSGKK